MFYFLVMDSSSCSGPAPAYKCQRTGGPRELSSPALCQAPGCECPSGPEVPRPPMKLGPPCLVGAGSSQTAGPVGSRRACETVATGRSSGGAWELLGQSVAVWGREVGRPLPLGTEPLPSPCQAGVWFPTACQFQGARGGARGIHRPSLLSLSCGQGGLSRSAEQCPCSASALLSARLRAER